MKQRRKLAYSLEAKNGGGFRTYIVPKERRRDKRKVDCIELYWRSSEEAKNSNEWHSVALKDWEAIAIIEGLSAALFDRTNSREYKSLK